MVEAVCTGFRVCAISGGYFGLDFVSTSLVVEAVYTGFRVRVISGRGCLYWISCPRH